MNADYKGPWLEALRSGTYVQAQGKLSDRDPEDYDPDTVVGFCCLGVLCEVSGWEYDPEDGGIASGPVELVGIGDEVRGELLGLSGLTWNERNELANMNDRGVPFVEVADWIEREL